MNPTRVAIFRALNLGDLLLSVPAFRALRARFPRAEISFIGLPWAAGFVDRFSSYLDRFVEFPGFPGIQELPFHPVKTAHVLRRERSYHYDLAIQMHGDGRTSNRFVLSLGAAATAGHHPRDAGPRLDYSKAYPENVPEVSRNLEVAVLCGCRDLDPALEF